MKYFSYNALLSSIRLITKNKVYVTILLSLMITIGILYYYLLYNAATGIINFGNYYVYFDVISAVLVSVLISFVITLNVYSYKTKTKGSKKLSIASIVSAILPSSLCCTSIVPSIFAIAGASTPFIIGNTGKIQSIFAFYGPIFIVFGIAVAFIGLMQISYNISKECPLNIKDIECCEVENENKD